jgi:DNA-binding transcriptional regulator YdaS (Cro superfamily)
MGGVLPTARQIGIKHPTVYQWQSGLVPVSMESAQKLEEVSGVPAESMSRPLREMLQRQRELYAKRVA